MEVLLLKILAILILVGALLTVPFGLPGVWAMVAVLLVGVVVGWVSWPVWGILAVAAGISELLEFLVLKRMGDRYGGSRGAFWGAVAGGFLGVFVGLPVPVAGPLLAGLVGTFVGAGLVTLYETRSMRDAGRVGWGLLLARIVAVGLKVGVGVAVLVVGGGAVFLE